jgi:hypothetical protein
VIDGLFLDLILVYLSFVSHGQVKFVTTKATNFEEVVYICSSSKIGMPYNIKSTSLVAF